jgi:DNA-binding NarL/FixJ family response regulator
VARSEPRIAIVGPAGALAGEALTWLLTSSGNRVIGSFADVAELERARREGMLGPQAIIVAASDSAKASAIAIEARRVYPQLKILLLCATVSGAVVRCVIDQGVDGLVLHSDGAAEVAEALRHVLEGRSVMPAGWQGASLQQSGALGVLSAREREVLELAAAGLSNREIGERLIISANTVKFHLRTIYSRLGVRSRLHATQVLSLCAGDPVSAHSATPLPKS